MITAANALICIKSSYSTANDQAVGDAGRIDNAIRQKPGRSMANPAAQGSVAPALREHDLSENVIAQSQAGPQQRVGG